ncbi:MAG: nucleoside phosphorylase [Oscillospiraceae bacterium]|nr:nucleoside phosphorylase [Oscillospiraceae bacterium]
MTQQMALGSDDNRQYHIALSPGDCEYAILPGDPGRVEEIAGYLENPEFVTEKREYKTYRGTIAGKSVYVTSTGIGGPSAAIALEELYKCGVRTFIRVGTCGGMQSDVMPGNIVIASSAIRAEGTSGEYLPPGYPAAASFTVTSALESAARQLGLTYHVGVVHSKDSFYGQTEPDSMPIAPALKDRWSSYVRAGCLASEMEAAALFSVGLCRNARVGVVLTAVWNPERHKLGLEQTEYHGNDRAISCAVKAIELLMDMMEPLK